MATYTITVTARGYQNFSQTVEADSLEEAKTFETQAVQSWMALNDQLTIGGGTHGISGSLEDSPSDVRELITVRTV